MNLFRTLRGAVVVGLAGMGFSGCINAPDYPITPEIDLKSFNMVRFKPGPDEVDTLKFSLNFRDGDGDLGLSDEDIKVAPWNATNGGPNNRGYAKNYIIQPFKRVNGTFVAFVNPGGKLGEYDGRFLHLDAEKARPAPLKGVLNYKLPLYIDGAPFFPGDVLRFEISILDRALHRSSVITTPPVTLGR